MRGVFRDNKGFSLLELLVVLIIMSVLSAVAAPGVSRMMENYRVKATSRQLISDLQLAKMKAVSENANYQVYFDLVNAKYRVEKSDGTNNGPWRSLGDTTNPYYTKGVSLAKNFTGNLVVFTPIGEALDSTNTPFAPDDARVTVSSMSATPRVVSVASSGRISVA
jgi:prepilin-type N-terminal cleavage/methylation domain-containing protein